MKVYASLDNKLEAIQALRKEGKSWKAIAKELKVSEPTLRLWRLQKEASGTQFAGRIHIGGAALLLKQYELAVLFMKELGASNRLIADAFEVSESAADYFFARQAAEEGRLKNESSSLEAHSEDIKRMVAEGATYTEIAQAYGVAKSTVWKFVQKNS